MGSQPIQFPIPPPKEKLDWGLDAIDGGVVYTDLPQKLNKNQSPKMLNLWYRERALTKRYGQEDFWTGLPGPIKAIYKNFGGYAIIHSGTGIYKGDYVAKTVSLLYNVMTTSKGTFLTFKDKTSGANKLFYKNIGSYVVVNTSFVVTSVVGYIPTVIMGRTPTGGGNAFENYNRLQAGFTTSFSATGSSTTYLLPQLALDATTVTGILNGVVKVEGVDFTVNRLTGVITFGVAPTAGTDNLLITAYKTDTASLNAFMINYLAIAYGGNNDNRIFFGGGTNTYYYAGVQDPTYIPEQSYNTAGVDDEVIYGFGIQYNVLVVLKANKAFAITYNAGATILFPMALLNPTMGCDCSWSIQTIGDNLVWLHSEKGVCILNSTNLKDEKNVSQISLNVDGTVQNLGILNNTKADIQDCTTYDYWGMYWLCIGSKVWVWDYNLTPYVNSGDPFEASRRLAWFPFDNINAGNFFDYLGELYHTDRTTGKAVRFIPDYFDFGLAINGYWYLLLNAFGLFDWYKNVLEVRYSTKSDVRTEVTVEYIWDNSSRVDPKVDKVQSFRWDRFNWSHFTWRVIKFARTITKYPKIKNTIFFQIKFSNNNAGENLSLLDLAIVWQKSKKVK